VKDEKEMSFEEGNMEIARQLLNSQEIKEYLKGKEDE